MFFSTALEALSYLEKATQKCFLILCDINLPGMDGIAFKKAINDKELLRKKAVPFIFYTGSHEKYAINKAFFDSMVQGYFVKESNYGNGKSTIKTIVDY
jgi:CheY-like chemotaxis protein